MQRNGIPGMAVVRGDQVSRPEQVYPDTVRSSVSCPSGLGGCRRDFSAGRMSDAHPQTGDK